MKIKSIIEQSMEKNNSEQLNEIISSFSYPELVVLEEVIKDKKYDLFFWSKENNHNDLLEILNNQLSEENMNSRCRSF